MTYVGKPIIKVEPVRGGRGLKLTITQMTLLGEDDTEAVETLRFEGYYADLEAAFESAKRWLDAVVIL